MYDSRHVSKIIQMGYLETPPLTIQAIRALSIMHKQDMLNEYAIDFVCKFVLRKSAPVATDEAIKILGFEYSIKDDKPIFEHKQRESIQSVQILAEILHRMFAEVETRRKKAAFETAMEALEKATVSVYDLRSMCNLLMSGEKEQASETKLPDEILDTLVDMLHLAF